MSAGANEIGAAFIRILPDTTAFGAELEAQISRALVGARAALEAEAGKLNLAQPIQLPVEFKLPTQPRDALGRFMSNIQKGTLTVNFGQGAAAAAGIAQGVEQEVAKIGSRGGSLFPALRNVGVMLGQGLDSAIDHSAGFLANTFERSITAVSRTARTAFNFAQDLAAPVALGAAAVLGGGLIAGGQLDKARQVFTQLTGSAALANEMITSLRKTTILTGLDFGVMSQSAQQLLAVGLDPARIEKTLNAVAQFEVVTGRGALGFQRASIQLQDIALRGTVQGQQLNALARDGIPAYEALIVAAERSGKLSGPASKQANQLAAATDAVSKAQLRLQTAQQNAATAQAKYGQNSAQYANAQRTVEIATLNLKDAQAKLTQTDSKANDARAQAIELMKAGQITADEYYAALSDPKVLGAFAAAVGAIQNNIFFQLTKLKNVTVHLFAQIFEPVQNVFGEALAKFTGPLGDLVENQSSLLNALGKRLAQVFTPLVPLFDKLGRGVVRFITYIGQPGGLDKLIADARKLLPVLGPLAGFFAALSSKTLRDFSFGLIPRVNPIVGILAGIVATQPQIRRGLEQIFQAARPLLATFAGIAQSVAKALLPVLLDLVREVVPLATELFKDLNLAIEDMGRRLAPLSVPGGPLSRMGDAIHQIFRDLQPLIPELVHLAEVVLVELAKALVQIVPLLLPLVDALLRLATVILPPLTSALEWLLDHGLVPLIPALLLFGAGFKVFVIVSSVARWFKDLAIGLGLVKGAKDALHLSAFQWYVVMLGRAMRTLVSATGDLAVAMWTRLIPATIAENVQLAIMDGLLVFAEAPLWAVVGVILLLTADIVLMGIALANLVTHWQDVITWTHKGREALSLFLATIGPGPALIGLLIETPFFDDFPKKLKALQDDWKSFTDALGTGLSFGGGGPLAGLDQYWQGVAGRWKQDSWREAGQLWAAWLFPPISIPYQATRLANWLIDVFAPAASQAGTWVQANFWRPIVQWTLGFESQIAQTVTGIGSGIVTWFTTPIVNRKKTFQQALYDTFIAPFARLNQWLTNMGTSWAQAIWNGFTNWLLPRIGRFLHGVKDILDRIGKKGSPYRLFIPVGHDIAGGIAQGIEKGSYLAHSAAGNLLTNLSNASAVGGVLPALVPAGNQPISVTVNVTNSGASANDIAQELSWALARRGKR